jgi:DNA-binding MarR family transcriptional regulator
MDEVQARATEAMMAVSRTMTAIVARTFHDVEAQITVPQLRVLVLLSSRGPMNLTTIARHLDVNPSNAGRTCDQLVGSKQVSREPDPQDRRSAVLRLTERGTNFVADLMAARRKLINDAIAPMSPSDQDILARGLEAFLAAITVAPIEEKAIDQSNGRIIPWLL